MTVAVQIRRRHVDRLVTGGKPWQPLREGCEGMPAACLRDAANARGGLLPARAEAALQVGEALVRGAVAVVVDPIAELRLGCAGLTRVEPR
ncbi:MAG: hypothetical protein L0221_12900, partial [Chloroflexi bacterium]|nr:hypothetical protein [Chloroflexota bacterium]